MTDNPEQGPRYSTEDVRQGEIILRKRWQRIAFIAGLIGMVVVAIAVGWANRA